MSEQPTKKTYKRQRGNQIILRFSDEELAELNERLSKSGLSKTDFFLQILRNSNIIILNDFKEICIELKKQGINLNQALKHYHETGFSEELKMAIHNCNEFYETAKDIFISADNKFQRNRRRKITGQQKKENGEGEA